MSVAKEQREKLIWEFPNIGNESGYNNQMSKKHRDEEIEPIMIFFKDV